MACLAYLRNPIDPAEVDLTVYRGLRFSLRRKTLFGASIGFAANRFSCLATGDSW